MHVVEGAVNATSATLAVAAIALAVIGSRRLAVHGACLSIAWLGLTRLRHDPSDGVAAVLATCWQPMILLTVWAATGLRRSRTVTIAAWALVGAGVARVAFYEPFADPACEASCFRRQLTVRADLQLADRLLFAGAVLAAVSGVALIGMLLVRAFRRRTSLRVRPVTGLCASAAVVVGSILVARSTTDGMPERPSDAVLVLRSVEGATVVVLLLAGLVERIGMARRLRHMADVLDQGLEPAHDQLMRALGDSTATISIRIGDDCDAARCPSLPDPQGRRTTRLILRDHPVAEIDHRDDIDPADLIGRLGPQFVIAVQNDLLAEQQRQRLHELEASRARVIAAGDSERERLERDLHDGAQQRVLALSFELRRGRRYAEDAGDEVAAARWASATSVTLTLLQRLRHLAAGIYPAALDGVGLADALRSLSGNGPQCRPVEVRELERVSTSTARAAYAIVRDCAPLVPGRTIVATRAGELMMTFDGGAQPAPAVLDRVVATGGTHRAIGTAWEVRLPCA